MEYLLVELLSQQKFALKPHREHFIITPVCSKAQQACHNSNIKLKIIFHVGIINRIIVPIKEEDVIKIDINFHHTTLIQRKMIMT